MKSASFAALIFLLLVIIYLGLPFRTQAQTLTDKSGAIAIVIHGGAGTITKSSMTPEFEKEYRDKLTEALTTGYDILKRGGSAVDAVETAIKIMEDSPL